MNYLKYFIGEKNKEASVTLFFITASIFLFTLFKGIDIFQKSVIMLVFFAILPLLFNRFFLRKRIDFFGLGFGDWKKGLFWSCCSLIVVGFIFFIISYYFKFLEYYIIPKFITEGFGKFLLYEFTVVALIVALYEFFFRGFVMFIFKPKVKYWAILLQTVVFLVVCFSIGGSAAMFLLLPYLVFAPFAGIIAYESESILYSGVSQFLIIFCLDVLVVKMLR